MTKTSGDFPSPPFRIEGKATSVIETALPPCTAECRIEGEAVSRFEVELPESVTAMTWTGGIGRPRSFASRLRRLVLRLS